MVKGPSILGRDLMAKFKLPWQNIFHMVSTTSEDIVSQYPNLFDNTTMGKLKGIQVSLRVKEANPVFNKPRVVPFAIRPQYEEALEKIVRTSSRKWNIPNGLHLQRLFSSQMVI